MKDNDKDILHTWKEISQYLKHDVRTCSKWEKELDLPIHRYDNRSSKSNVFAYKSELDEWLQRRINRNGKQEDLIQARKRPWLLISAIAALSIIVLVAIIKLTPIWNTKSLSETATIALLPIESRGLDEYDEYLSEGIGSGILSSLTVLDGIRINPDQESSEVDYLLKGTVEKVEDRIHLSLSLIRQKDQKTVWQNDYKDKLSNLFYIQRAASRGIYESIGIRSAQGVPSFLKQRTTIDSKAVDSYLKGNYILARANDSTKDPWKLYFQGKYYNDIYTKESNEIAIELFKKAIAIDPNLAQAYVGLASCYANYFNLGWDDNEQWLQDADSLLNKVQSINTDYPEYYHASIKVFLLKKYSKGEDWDDEISVLAKEGSTKFPGHATLNAVIGHWNYGRFGDTGITEYLDLALDYYEKAHWLSPLSLWNVSYAELLVFNREFYKALDVCNPLIEIDSTYMAIFRLGEIYYYMDELDKSEAIFSQIHASPEYNAAALSDLGRIAARRGDKQRAKEILEELLNLSPKRFVTDFNFASIYFGIGDEEEGYKYIYKLCTDPMWHQIRYTHYINMQLDKNFEEFIKDGGLERLKVQIRDN